MEFTSHITPARNPATAVRKTLSPQRCFMEIKLDGGSVVGDMELRALIFQALKQMYGDNGLAVMEVDILSWSAETATGIISSEYHNSTAVRAALAFLTSFDGRAIRVNVLRTSADLVALATPTNWMSGL